MEEEFDEGRINEMSMEVDLGGTCRCELYSYEFQGVREVSRFKS